MRRSPLESSVQRAVVDYAKKLGMVAIKLTVAGFRGVSGWPDYLLLGQCSITEGVTPPHADEFTADVQVTSEQQVVLFVEFKRRGKVPTLIQLAKHVELRALGFRVEVVDDPEVGRALVHDAMCGRRP